MNKLAISLVDYMTVTGAGLSKQVIENIIKATEIPAADIIFAGIDKHGEYTVIVNTNTSFANVDGRIRRLYEKTFLPGNTFCFDVSEVFFENISELTWLFPDMPGA